MKRIILSNIILLMCILAFAQEPESFNYQAIVRNVAGEAIVDQSVSYRFSIIKGSPAGSVVYMENHGATTNQFGLVALAIGNGTDKTGDFSAIDWGADSYFLKVEIDVTGGTTYADMGTTQLLSVPYALHAKTAESITGGLTDVHYVGELYGGGVVFWVDHTGQHGLICSLIDLSSGEVWSNVFTTLVGSTAQSDWDGPGNSNAITGQSGHASSAAKLCLDYTNADYGTGTYSDWYLASRGELNQLWNNIDQVQKAIDTDGNGATTTLAKGSYWSSSEYGSNYAWAFYFNYGYAYYSTKNYIFYVRAIRAF